MRRPLDRLTERMDERQAALELYPPRATRPPGCSSAILTVSAIDGAAPSFADAEPEGRESPT